MTSVAGGEFRDVPVAMSVGEARERAPAGDAAGAEPAGRADQTAGAPAGTVVIRAARPDDVPAILHLQEVSIMGLGVATYGAAKARAWARFGIEQSRDLLSQGSFFVAEREGQALGVSGWSPDVERRDTAWIRYVFVRPEAAGRGLGRRLVTTAEGSALATGRGRFRLWASLNALRFYERLGYQRVRSARWPVEPGIELDYVLMARPGLGRRAPPRASSATPGPRKDG